MKKFTFTVKDTFTNFTYDGEIEAANMQEARNEILDEYAYELDTTPDDLMIMELQEVK